MAAESPDRQAPGASPRASDQDPGGQPPIGATSSGSPSRHRHTAPRRALWVLLAGLITVLLGAAATALFVVTRLDDWIAETVVREGARHGLIVAIGKLEWSLNGAVLEDTRVTLSGVPGIVIGVDRLETDVLVDLRGISITRAEVQGAQASVVGSAALVGFQLGQWTAKYAKEASLPLRASGLDIRWKADPAHEPWLEVLQATVIPGDGSGTLAAAEVILAGQSLGALGGAWTKDSSNFTLGLGEKSLESAPVQVNVVHSSERPAIDLLLSPTPLERLERAFGIDLPDEPIEVEMRVHLELSAPILDGAASGWLKATLHGFVPPHPVELDGFVFGDRTDFETQLFVDEGRERIRLENARVQAGAFALSGHGAVLRGETDARLLLELSGALPCTALAGAALETRLGKVIGPWLRRAAELALQGSVMVSVKVDASSAQLDDIKVARVIGVGCGLRPIRLPGLEDFELPELGKLPRLDQTLPDLPIGIPSLPGMKPREPASDEPRPSLPLPKLPWDRSGKTTPQGRPLDGSGAESEKQPPPSTG